MGRAVRWAWDVAIGVCAGGTIIRVLQTKPADRDFVPFFSTGRLLASAGGGRAIYDLDAQGAVQHAIFGAGATFQGADVLPFLYPPWIGALFVPIAVAPVGVAFGIWTAISIALLAAVLIDLRGRTRALSCDAPPGLVLLALVPIYDSLAHGQLSILLLAAWWLALTSLLDGRDTRAGLALSLACCKPQMAALLAIGFAADRRWKALAWAAATQAAAWALSAIVFGPAVVPGYVDILRMSATTPFNATTMPTPRGVLALIGVPSGVAMGIAMACWLASLVAAAGIWRGRRFDVASRLGLTTLLATVFSPHLYLHDLSLFGAAAGADAVRATGTGTPWTSREFLVPAWLLLGGLWAVESSWPAIGAPAMLLGTGWFAVVVARRALRACPAVSGK